MKTIVSILVALVAMIGMVGAQTTEEMDDPGYPNLVATANGDILTIQNIGTDTSVDLGGARIVVDNTTVGILPYTVILEAGTFAVRDYSITVKLTRALETGEKFCVTNGLGTYVSGVAQ